MLKEALFTSPLSLMIGCAAILPLSVWILSLVNWMIMGEIDFLSGILGCLMGLVLGMLAIAPPDPRLSPLFFGAILAVVVLYPVIRCLLNKREMVAIDTDAMENCYEILAVKPDNVGAKWRIAKIIFSRGLTGQALAIGEESIAVMPEAIFQDEHRTIKKWRKDVPPNQVVGLPCLECGTMNGPSEVVCRRCGCRHLIAHVQGRWMGPKMVRRLVGAWVAATLALVGIPTLAVSAAPSVAAGLIPVLFIGAAFAAWLAFRKEVPKSA